MVTTQIRIQSAMTTYPSQDCTRIDAYLSRPATPGRYPGVVVIMEAMGLMDHIKDVCQRFAREGYIALAPDMYTREGSPSDPNDLDQVLKVLFAAPDSQAVADLEGAIAFLKGQAECNSKVGAIGFCSGGRYTLVLACQSKSLDAAIDSAGGYIIEETTPQRPVNPIDMIPSLSCPLLALFGEEDPNPPPEHAVRLKEELDKNSKTYELRMYSDAGHAFFADYRPSYRPVAAQDMWHRVLVFYEKYLKA